MDFELGKAQKEIQKAAREFAKGEFDRELALELDRKHEFPGDLEESGEAGFRRRALPRDLLGPGAGRARKHPDRRGVLRPGFGHRQCRDPGELCR